MRKKILHLRITNIEYLMDDKLFDGILEIAMKLHKNKKKMTYEDLICYVNNTCIAPGENGYAKIDSVISQVCDEVKRCFIGKNGKSLVD